MASPRRILWVGGFTGLVITIFFGAQYLRTSYMLRQTNTEIANITETAQLVLSQRRQALKNVQVIQSIRALGDEAQTLSAIFGLTAALSQHGLLITSLKVSENTLEVSLVGDTDLSSPDIVTRLEALPSLTNATVALDVQGNLSIKAVLVPFKTQDTLLFVQKNAGDSP